MNYKKAFLLVIPVLAIVGGLVEILFFLYFVAGVLGAILGAIYAKSINRSGWLWGILCFFIPYIFPIVLFFLKPKEEIQYSSQSTSTQGSGNKIPKSYPSKKSTKNILLGIFWFVLAGMALGFSIEEEEVWGIVVSAIVMLSGVVQLIQGIKQSNQPDKPYASSPSSTSTGSRLTYNSSSERVTTQNTDAGQEINVKWIVGYSVTIIRSGKTNKIKLPWLSDEFVEIINRIDVNRFLSNPELQNPLKNEAPTEGNSKANIGLWAEYLLAHPNSQVVVQMLDFAEPGLLSAHTIQNNLAALMIVGSEEIKKAIASRFWHKVSNRDNFFTILNNRGRMPAGFPGKQIEQAMSILKSHCPGKYMDEYRKYSDKYFVPQSSGVKSIKKPEQLVTFKEEYTRMVMGNLAIYKVYTAQTKSDALQFLEKLSVTEDMLYYEVETPEGNIGKDKMGIY